MAELGYADAVPAAFALARLGSKIRHHFVKARQRHAMSERTIQDLRQRLAEVENSRWWRLGKKLRATTKSIMPNA
jgi:hypothetical protein